VKNIEQIKIIFDSEKQILINTVEGSPTADDYMLSIKSSLDKHPMKYLVWDYTKAVLSGLTNQDLKNIMHFAVSHPNTHIHVKVALILPTDLAYGLGRMFAVYGEIDNAPWKILPFRSAEEAFDWLGVPDIRKKNAESPHGRQENQEP